MAFNKIQSLWTKTFKKSGMKYIGPIDIRPLKNLNPDRSFVFISKNEKKQNEKDPDWTMTCMEVEPKPEYKKPSPSLPPPSQVDDPDDFGF